MSKWSEADKESFINHLVKGYRGTVVSRGEILEEVRQKNLPYPRFILDNPAAKSGRGMYDLGCFAVTVAEPEVETVAMSAQVLPMVRQKKLESTLDNTVPNKDVNYVAFGFHKDLKKILESKIFYPVFITGLSGNGKTTMVEQVCAELKREVLRVNISIETDEDDLIGGNTLIDGNVV